MKAFLHSFGISIPETLKIGIIHDSDIYRIWFRIWMYYLLTLNSHNIADYNNPQLTVTLIMFLRTEFEIDHQL